MSITAIGVTKSNDCHQFVRIAIFYQKKDRHPAGSRSFCYVVINKEPQRFGPPVVLHLRRTADRMHMAGSESEDPAKNVETIE